MLAINHFGVWALAWREVARAVLVAAGMWLFCRWIPGWPSRKGHIKALLHYGSHITLNQFVIACVGQLDRLLIGKFFGASPLGLYRQAQQLILAPIEQLRAPVYSVASPSLSMLQTDPDRYRRYYQRIVLVIGLATMPLGLFISIYAGEITHVLLGPRWIAATVFLQIFGIVAFLKPSLDTTAIVMMTYGLSKRLLTISIAYYVSLAAFMFVGLYWGAEGVALANVGAIVLLMLPMLYFSLRRTPVYSRSVFQCGQYTGDGKSSNGRNPVGDSWGYLWVRNDGLAVRRPRNSCLRLRWRSALTTSRAQGDRCFSVCRVRFFQAT